MTHRSAHHEGFTLIEIMISILLVGLLAAIALPNFMRSRTTAQTNVCISNLRNIDHAIQQWAMEFRKAPNAPVEFSDISSYLRNSVICPAGGVRFADSYNISVVGTEPTCQRYPGTHMIIQIAANEEESSSPSGSPPEASPSQGPANHGNGNGNANGNADANGNGNGNAGNSNGNGNNP